MGCYRWWRGGRATTSVSEQLKANPDTAHIPIHYDPGHIKKNFQKSLMAIYGQGVRYKGLAERGGQLMLHTPMDAETCEEIAD